VGESTLKWGSEVGLRVDWEVLPNRRGGDESSPVEREVN